MDKTGTLIHDFKTGNHLTDLQLCSRRRSLWEHQDGGRLRHRNYILRIFLSIFFNPHLRTCSCKNFFRRRRVEAKNRTFKKKKKKDFCSKTTTKTFFSNFFQIGLVSLLSFLFRISIGVKFLSYSFFFVSLVSLFFAFNVSTLDWSDPTRPKRARKKIRLLRCQVALYWNYSMNIKLLQ